MCWSSQLPVLARVPNYPTHTWCGGFPIIPYIWRALHTFDRRWRRGEISPQGHIRPGKGICLVQESIEAVISNCSQELLEQPYWGNFWNRLTKGGGGICLVQESIEAVISNCGKELVDQPYWENCWNRLMDGTDVKAYWRNCWNRITKETVRKGLLK